MVLFHVSLHERKGFKDEDSPEDQLYLRKVFFQKRLFIYLTKTNIFPEL